MGTAIDLGGWLRSLGLEGYEAAFRENEIDETVLPNLTAQDLKETRCVAKRDFVAWSLASTLVPS